MLSCDNSANSLDPETSGLIWILIAFLKNLFQNVNFVCVGGRGGVEEDKKHAVLPSKQRVKD